MNEFPKMKRFTAYRRNLSERGTHGEAQANPDDQPQYEGVVFSDGTTVIKWLTVAGGVSTFSTLEKALSTHGHPEYGTDIVWHDGGDIPEEWKHQLLSHAEKLQHEYHKDGYTDVTLQVEEDAKGALLSLVLKNMDETIHYRVYPVPVVVEA